MLLIPTIYRGNCRAHISSASQRIQGFLAAPMHTVVMLRYRALGARAVIAQLLCRILLRLVLPTVGSSPESRVGITHFQLLCQFMVGRITEKWG